MSKVFRRPSPSLVLSFIAVAIAIGGTAIALPGRNTVDSGDIKPKNVRNGDLAPNAVTSGKVRNTSLNEADLRDFEVLGGNFVRVVATEAPTAAAARDAAPLRQLFRKGPLAISAKCFRDTGADTTHGEIYGATTRAGSVQEGSDDLEGGNAATDFLNPDTPETDRVLDLESATGNTAQLDELEGVLAAPGGAGLAILTWIAVKNGNLAGGNGIYGDAPGVCLFGGSVFG